MEGYHFKNWAQTYECHPEKYFEPNNVDELRSILKKAHDEVKSLRLVGFGHSPSDLCLTDDFMVSMKKFDRILDVDKEKKTVLVEGGVLLKDLVQNLKKHNLAMSVLPAIGELTIAGLMSTCTHSSGVSYPVLADYAISLTLLTADGQLIRCSRQENGDLFHAVCGGLGTLGIVVSVELQCEENYSMKQLRYPMKFQDFVQSVDELCRESDHFRAHYFPHTDRVIASSVYRSKLTQRIPPPSAFQRSKDWIWNVLVFQHLLELLYFIGLSVPFMVNVANWVIYYLLFSSFDFIVDDYENLFFANCLFHQYVSEWMIPRSTCGEALRRVKQAIAVHGIHAHFSLEIRFVRRDSFWLSPAYERDVCSINVVAYCPYDRRPDHDQYWKIFMEIMNEFGGRPHLAKNHCFTRKEMRKAFPRFDDFMKLRRRMDPNNIFVNAYIKRVLEDDHESNGTAKNGVPNHIMEKLT